MKRYTVYDHNLTGPSGRCQLFTFPPHPGANQSGTLREQLTAVACYLAGDAEVRSVDRLAAWKVAREAAIPHARRAQ